jgi:mannose-6-phosphate isomerase-like protein (cupin superfamily)
MVSGQEAIEKRYAAEFASAPSAVRELVQVYAIGKALILPPSPRHGCHRRRKNFRSKSLSDDQSKLREETMKTRLLLTLAGLAIGFAVPSIAQDAMKVVTADELVWKEHPVFKGAQTVILVGDPTKAETIVQRVKFPPHTHPYSEVVTVLSGTYWNAMGDDMEKGVMLKPGSVFVLPANHIHHTWTTDEEVILQI